jgi:hypothetical protein
LIIEDLRRSDAEVETDATVLIAANVGWRG